MLAVALMDGDVVPGSFSDARRADPALRALMQRVSVHEDPELTREHAGELPNWPSTVEVVLVAECVTPGWREALPGQIVSMRDSTTALS